jgi:hypothetical protein
MIEIPHEALGRFRSVLRKSVLASQPRGPCPAIVCLADKETLTLSCEMGAVGLSLRLPGKRTPCRLCLPVSLLAGLEASGSQTVKLEQAGPSRCRASWYQDSQPRALEFEVVQPPKRPETPETSPPVEMEAGFLSALAEAARTAARENGLSLCKVLLRGKGGCVVATDGKQLMVQTGFALPWQDDLLVPALPAFACKELAAQPKVLLSRAGEYVTLTIGCWSLTLKGEAPTRYPDYERVLQDDDARRTRLSLHPADVASLLRELPRMPGTDEDRQPVVLEIKATASVVARQQEGDEELLRLSKSKVEGPAVRVATDRRFLIRALKLGFTELSVAPGRPLLCSQPRRSYLWMPLDLPSAARAAVTPKASHPMPNANGNGNNHRDAPPSVSEPDDPLTEAELLRNVLQESLARTSRLIAALKRQKRQSKAVQSAVASLRKLQQLAE